MQTLYLEYDMLAMTYSGWGLNELKSLTYRERQYWKRLNSWRRERNGT
jgi:hypothetical protein